MLPDAIIKVQGTLASPPITTLSLETSIRHKGQSDEDPNNQLYCLLNQDREHGIRSNTPPELGTHGHNHSFRWALQASP